MCRLVFWEVATGTVNKPTSPNLFIEQDQLHGFIIRFLRFLHTEHELQPVARVEVESIGTWPSLFMVN